MKYRLGLVALVVACSGSNKHAPEDSALAADAAGDGWSADGNPDDGASNDGPAFVPPASADCDINAAPGLVHVRLINTGAHVIAHHADGSFYGRTTSIGSYPNTTADIMVPGCGSVTVVDGRFYITVMYVRAGDDLWMEYGQGRRFGPGRGPAHIVIDAPFPGAPAYRASAVIGDAPGPMLDVLWLDDQVTSQGVATVLVQPVSTSTGLAMPDKYALLEDVSLPNAVQTPLHITSWSTSQPAHHFNATFPKLAHGWQVHLGSTKAGFVYNQHEASSQTSSTTASFDIQFPEFGTGALFTMQIAGEGDPNLGIRTRYWRKNFAVPLPSTVQLDLTNELLPEVLSVSASLDPTRSTVSWTVEPSQEVEDAVAISLYDDQATLWRIAAPPGIRSLRVPELPQDVRLTFSTRAVAGVTLHEESILTGYAEARQGVADLFGGLGGRLLQDGMRWRRSRSGIDAP